MTQKQTARCNSFRGWLTLEDVTYSTDLLPITLGHLLIQASVFGDIQ